MTVSPPRSVPHPSTSGRLTLLVFACLLIVSALRADETRPVRILPREPAPVFDGWGTSLCWFANAVGRWPEPQRSEIADALFSREGLGLTAVRYNIGGGENPAHRHMPWFRQMEGFSTGPGEWNWSADAGQRWMLAAAIARGANRLEAFSNSPPWWMTTSQCASGAVDPKTDNLAPEFEGAFVDYLTGVVQHFRDEWHIDFDTLEPMNEPFTDYWRANGNQEGCHFDRASQARLIGRLRAALDARGLAAVKIAASDETNYDRTIGTWEAFDAATRANVAQINAHAYATDRRSELRALATASAKPLVMSEVDGGGDAPHDHAAIAPALGLARNIVDDLRDLQPLRWVFWQAVEDEKGQVSSNQHWGLIHADLHGDSHAWARTKKFFALANFSRFIRPDAVLLAADAPGIVAALDRARGTLTIVACNSQETDAPMVFDLSHFGADARPVSIHRTSATEDLAALPDGRTVEGKLSTTLRSRSVTTLVVALNQAP